MKADYILFNGTIYKSDEKKSCVEAIAISSDKIICADTLQKCEAYKTESTKMVDIKGRLVLPGIIDGHTHPETIAKSRWRLLMPTMEDKDELLSYIKKYCDEHTIDDVPFVFASAYPSTMFDEKGPRKEWLDEYVSDRPVRIQDFTDHACWYNSKALELMGITKDTPNRTTVPFFVRDRDGEPTGWVLEPMPDSDFENQMYKSIGWWPPTEVTENTLLPFLELLNDYGVTALLDGFTEGENAIKTYYNLDLKDKLHIYYEGAYKIDGLDDLDDAVKTIKVWQKKYSSKHVRIHTVKLFLDQTNEMGTGASLEPHYNDLNGENYGQLNMCEEDLVKLLIRLNKEKLDLHVHVVCDRGFRVACNAYEKAKDIVTESGMEWGILMELAHCELVHPDDMARPAELGIMINWSCHWAGGYFGDAAIDYLGRKRWESMYDFTKMIRTGAVVTYSSDVIGEDEEYRCNPFLGMEISATRIDCKHPMDEKLCPGHVRQPELAKLDIPELIKGYTRYGAIPLRLEDKIGTLEEGKQANLIILNKNIFETKLTEIHTIKPDAVMFEGVFIR